MNGYISIGELGVLILAFLVTFVHFSFMVWYRKKEQLFDPSISSIIDHILQSKPREEKSNKIYKNKKASIFSSIKKILVYYLLKYFYIVLISMPL